MDDLATALMVILGTVLRVGIPVALTILVIRWLHQLDSQWLKQADQDSAEAGVTRLLPGNIGCWEINGCSQEKKESCKAYAHPESPCWQVFRGKDGALQERCLGCKVFKETPIPVIA